MNNQQPIDLPSPALVQRIMFESGFAVPDPDNELAFPKSEYMKFASKLIRYAVDAELDACCEWLDDPDLNVDTYKLRAARRAQPQTLKKQALSEVAAAVAGGNITPERGATIRLALEALPND